MKGFLRATAAIGLVAVAIGFLDPANTRTTARVALFGVVVAGAAALVGRLRRSVPPAEPGPFTPVRPRPATAPTPPAMASYSAAFGSCLTGYDRRLGGPLRATLRSVAAARLAHHGLDLAEPGDEAAIRARLGDEAWTALTTGALTGDPAHLVDRLEAL